VTANRVLGPLGIVLFSAAAPFAWGACAGAGLPESPEPALLRAATPPPRFAAKPVSTGPVVVAAVATQAPPPKPSAPKSPWPEGVDRSLPAPQRAVLLGGEVGGELLLALTGVTSKSEHFLTNPEPGTPPAATQEATYYVTMNAITGCLNHSDIFPELSRARTDPSQTDRERLFEKTAVKGEVSVLRALFARFRVRAHDGVAISPDGKTVLVESSSFISGSLDGGASYRDFGPGAAAAPGISPSGRYAAMRLCGSPCGGVYRLGIVDLISGVRRTVGYEDTEDTMFAADDSLYSVRTNGGGLKKPNKVCLDQTTFPGWLTHRVSCRTLGESAAGGGSSMSANGKYVSLIGEAASKERVFVLSVPDGKETFAFDPSTPIVTGSHVNNRGVFAFTRFSATTNQDVALFAPDREGAVGHAAAGFLTSGELVAVPTFPRSSDEPKALQTLGDVGACGWVKRIAP
jgi:hypothetical protein